MISVKYGDNMKKNGFTLVELLAVVVILGIIMAVAIVSYTGNMQRSKDKTFEMAEKDFQSAASNAYIQYLSNQDLRLSNVFDDLTYSNKTTVYLKDLINYDYIKKIKNPYNTEEMCDFENSNVVIEKTVGAKDDFNYQVCLICGDNKSDNCLGSTYYAFGTPTTESTTDYTTLGRNVFATLGTDGSTGVCINNGGLFCLKINDYDNSVVNLKAHFGETNCLDNNSYFRCTDMTIRCYAYANGRVYCIDDGGNAACNVSSDGVFKCYEPEE